MFNPSEFRADCGVAVQEETGLWVTLPRLEERWFAELFLYWCGNECFKLCTNSQKGISVTVSVSDAHDCVK